jgi:hypothetical protein
VVEETLEPGASVARVARKHGINANQVFQWRRMYREGRLGGERHGEVKLLPIAVSEVGELFRVRWQPGKSSSSGRDSYRAARAGIGERRGPIRSLRCPRRD